MKPDTKIFERFTQKKLFHENALDFYDYLWELKCKLQIERMICNGKSACAQVGVIFMAKNHNIITCKNNYLAL